MSSAESKDRRGTLLTGDFPLQYWGKLPVSFGLYFECELKLFAVSVCFDRFVFFVDFLTL